MCSELSCFLFRHYQWTEVKNSATFRILVSPLPMDRLKTVQFFVFLFRHYYNGHRLKTVQRFVYFGRAFSTAVHIDYETNFRIAKVYVTFGKLKSLIWNRRSMKLSTKLKGLRSNCSIYSPVGIGTRRIFLRGLEKVGWGWSVSLSVTDRFS